MSDYPTLHVSDALAAKVWSNALTRQSATSTWLPARPQRTPEEEAAWEVEYAARQDRVKTDEAKVPAFLAALDALCREHGATIKAMVGGGYDGDSFTAYLGEAEIANLKAGYPTEPTP